MILCLIRSVCNNKYIFCCPILCGLCGKTSSMWKKQCTEKNCENTVKINVRILMWFMSLFNVQCECGLHNEINQCLYFRYRTHKKCCQFELNILLLFILIIHIFIFHPICPIIISRVTVETWAWSSSLTGRALCVSALCCQQARAQRNPSL